MDSKITTYFRSMSLKEYKAHETLTAVREKTEWASQLPGSYTLHLLKSWVDKGHNRDVLQISSGDHDLIVMVENTNPEEFRLKTMGDIFIALPYDDTLQVPYRSINLVPIVFSRLNPIYDPRGLMNGNKIVELERMLSSHRFF